MSKINRKWILRSLQVLIALVLMLSVVPAGAHNSYGYLHHDKAGDKNYKPYTNPDWMAKIPDHRRLSELSIPETHDTMARHCLPHAAPAGETQSLDLKTQLESGIRSLDIRLLQELWGIDVYHGFCGPLGSFKEVLDEVWDFLDNHSSETILLRIAENSHNPAVNCPPFLENVEDTLQPYRDSGLIWNPTSTNPTLGEVRGKIVILEHFSRVGEQVDSGDENDVGMYSSLALDDFDNPHFSYYDNNTDDLRYAFNDSAEWHYKTVDDAGDVGQHTSIALDKNDYPHISYYDATNGDLKYARKMPGDPDDWWWFGPVDGAGSDVGQYSSIALDEDNRPHISYYDATNNELKYAHGTSWNEVSGWVWEQGQVENESVNDVGQYTSLALSLGADGKPYPHISYYDATNGDLKYARKMPGDPDGWWWVGPVDGEGNDVGQYSSIALDEYNQPHISYYDNTEHNLKYAFGTNWDEVTGWVWEQGQVDHGSANDVGMYSSLALEYVEGGGVIPHISYYDNNTDDLKYTFLDNDSGWVFLVGETGGTESVKGNVGLYTSLALDENNHPRVSYYDATNGDLLYAGLTSFCGDGVSAITQFGLKDKLPCFKEKVYWSFSSREDIYKEKWWRIKKQLDEADTGPLDRFYLNGLTGTGGTEQPFPWFIASGHVNSDTDTNRYASAEDCDGDIPPYPDFPCNNSGKMDYEGTNELTLTYLSDPEHQPLLQPRRWGIIVMDFPGRDLIDAIIQSNFQTVPTVWLPAITK